MRIILLLLLSATLCSAFAETALRDDGKQVELNADGSWTLLSNDVFATSASGLRVRLSEDGRWQALASNKSIATVATASPLAQASFNASVNLDRIAIQKVKVSRAGSKNTVYRQNILAHLQFDERPSAEAQMAENFEIVDSKGVSYPVISVAIDGANGLFVRALGAPDRWSRTQAIVVRINKQVLSSLADVSLSADFRDIKTKIIAAFVDQ